jgi:hypothetical protein
MPKTSISCPRRLSITLLSAALAAATLMAAPLFTPAAGAEIGACYTDPVVVLSNGMTLDISNTINDSYFDVQQVAYTLHAPVGVSVVSVIYTAGPIGPKETLRYYADSTWGRYTITSKVTTGASAVPVTASAQAVSLAGPSSTSASGWNNQQLQMSVSG